MSQPNMICGSYVGTGATIVLSNLGFIPDFVEIWNNTDGDEKYEWNRSMSNATAIKIWSQVEKVNNTGITPLSSATDGHGLTLGTSLSESGKIFSYRAMRCGAGKQNGFNAS